MKQPRAVDPEDLLGSLNGIELQAVPAKLFLRGDESLSWGFAARHTGAWRLHGGLPICWFRTVSRW